MAIAIRSNSQISYFIPSAGAYNQDHQCAGSDTEREEYL